jgi:hypothetical protein
LIPSSLGSVGFSEYNFQPQECHCQAFFHEAYYVDYMVNLEMTSLSRVFPQISTDAARDLMMKLSLLFIKQRENHIMA